MAVVACMATYPPRYNMAIRAMQHFAPQVDVLHVYVNDADRRAPWRMRTPKNVRVHEGRFNRGNLGDVGKFFPLSFVPPDSFVFLIDDDIRYPDDYVKKMIEAVERHERRAVVGVHGCDLPVKRKVRSYYGEGQINKKHFAAPVRHDLAAHLLGTGTVAFHTDTISEIRLETFTLQNMSDLYFAEYCQRQEIGMVIVRRRNGWVRPYPSQKDGIYERQKEHDTAQTHIVNRTQWRKNIHIKEPS